MEHGLDARHPRLSLRKSGAPALASRPPDIRTDLRVLGAVRAAAIARRSRTRKGIALRPRTRRPMAEARDLARLFRVHVDASWQEAALHGRRVRANPRVESRRRD